MKLLCLIPATQLKKKVYWLLIWTIYLFLLFKCLAPLAIVLQTFIPRAIKVIYFILFINYVSHNVAKDFMLAYLGRSCYPFSVCSRCYIHTKTHLRCQCKAVCIHGQFPGIRQYLNGSKKDGRLRWTQVWVADPSFLVWFIKLICVVIFAEWRTRLQEHQNI